MLTSAMTLFVNKSNPLAAQDLSTIVKVKALIIRDGCLLCQVKSFGEQSYLSLPGGTQEDGETLEQTLIRECAEEIGTTVIPHDLAFVFSHDKSFSGNTRKKLECVFSATIASGYKPQNGPNPDKGQIGIMWVKLSELHNHDFMPPELPKALNNSRLGGSQFYWASQFASATMPAKVNTYMV